MKNLFFLFLAIGAITALAVATKSDARDFISPSIMNTGDELRHLHRTTKVTTASTTKALNQLFSSDYVSFERKYNAYKIVEIAARESTLHEEQFKGDAHAARAHALMWHITRKDAHKRRSAEIIRAWATTFKDFKVVKGYKPQMYLESAWILPIWLSALDMIKGDLTDWTPTDERKFRQFIKKTSFVC